MSGWRFWTSEKLEFVCLDAAEVLHLGSLYDSSLYEGSVFCPA